MGGGDSAPLADNSQTVMGQNRLQDYAGAGSNKSVQDLLASYGSGKTSLADALSSIQGLKDDALPMLDNDWARSLGMTPPDASASTKQGVMDQLATNPLTAGRLASGQVMDNQLFSGLFGQDGLQGQAQNNYTNATNNLAESREALKGRDQSFGLQQSDLAAYGQGADQIGRQSAQQSQGIAQALASRGLGGGNNGAAIASYAGNYGNQMEQLAGLQNQISQNRITSASQLAQARNASDLAQQSNAGSLSQGLGQLGNQAYGTQLNSNLSGAQNNYNQLAGAAGSALNTQTGLQNINNEKYAQENQPSPIAGMIGTVAGGALGSIAGPIGTSIGASIGNSITGGGKK